MPRVRFEPAGLEIDLDETSSLRDAAYLLGVRLHDSCGGNGACCGCVVTVVAGMANICPKTAVEDAVFYLAENDRLSCQCRITGDVVVRVDSP